MALDGGWNPPEMWPESTPPLPGWVRRADGRWSAPDAPATIADVRNLDLTGGQPAPQQQPTQPVIDLRHADTQEPLARPVAEPINPSPSQVSRSQPPQTQRSQTQSSQTQPSQESVADTLFPGPPANPPRSAVPPVARPGGAALQGHAAPQGHAAQDHRAPLQPATDERPRLGFANSGIEPAFLVDEASTMNRRRIVLAVLVALIAAGIAGLLVVLLLL